MYACISFENITIFEKGNTFSKYKPSLLQQVWQFQHHHHNRPHRVDTRSRVTDLLKTHSRLTGLTRDSLVGCSDNGEGSGNSSCCVRCFESWPRHCRIKGRVPAICICCLPPHPCLHLIHSCGGLQRITQRLDRLASTSSTVVAACSALLLSGQVLVF